MKKRKLMAAMLAAVLALSLTACGGEKKPADTTDTTDTSQTDTSQTEKEQPEVKQEEAEPAEAEKKIPENGILFHLTNPKIQAQASFYLPKFDSEWEVELLSGTDPVNAEQRYLYKAKISDEQSAHVDARLTATTTENLPTIMENGEKVKVSGHDAVYEEDTTSWKYTVDMGPYADGVEMYMNLKFYTGGEEFKDVKELAETRDMMLETLSATTDYEGKEDRSGRLYQGSGLCSLPMTFDYNGQEVEVKQELRRASVYALAAEIQEDGDIPLWHIAGIGLLHAQVKGIAVPVHPGGIDAPVEFVVVHSKACDLFHIHITLSLCRIVLFYHGSDPKSTASDTPASRKVSSFPHEQAVFRTYLPKADKKRIHIHNRNECVFTS